MKQKSTLIKRLATIVPALALLLSACQKESSDSPTPTPAGSRIEKVALGDEFIQFSYNANGSLRQAVVKDEIASGGETVTFSLSYNAQQKISQVETSDGRRLIPVYVNGLVEKVEIRDAGNGLDGYTEYEYLNGRLKSATLVYLNGAEVRPWMKFIFNYNAAGNVVKTNLFFNDFLNNQLVSIGSVDYEYDNRPNPLAGLGDFLLFIWQVPSANNVKKETHIGDLNTIDEVLEYNYTYNSAGRPQSAQVTQRITGEAPRQLNLQFTYR